MKVDPLTITEFNKIKNPPKLFSENFPAIVITKEEFEKTKRINDAKLAEICKIFGIENGSLSKKESLFDKIKNFINRLLKK